MVKRKFNGKVYHAVRTAKTKTEAKQICKNARKRHHCRATYTPIKNGYQIWIKQYGA